MENTQTEVLASKPGKSIKILISLGALVVIAAAVYVFAWPVKGHQKSSDWRCAARGGEMVSTGCGIAGCYYECARVYSDGGKKCSSSKDCQGKCLTYIDFPILGSPSGPGKCAETSRVPNCSGAYELKSDGSAESVGMCSM
jgi:hypothetical protein